MHNLSRTVLDDTIEMTLRSTRLSDERKAGLLLRLRRIRDGFCDREIRCAGCPARCVCEDLVRQVFAGTVRDRPAG